MNSVTIKSFQFLGLEKQLIRVEALCSRGLANLNISGLPDTALKESREKVKQLVAQIIDWGPMDKVMVELSPSEHIKSGKHLELAIALACLCVLHREDKIPLDSSLSQVTFAGELSLSGEIRETDLTQALRHSELESFIGAEQYKTLEEVWEALKQGQIASSITPSKERPSFHITKKREAIPEVKGRVWERFCLLSACAAELPALLLGPPGIGKSFLSKWAAGLCPEAEADTLKQKQHIWRLAERQEAPLAPIMNPHAKVQLSEFRGVQRAGTEFPGLFSLAHGGTLILDEFAEMNRDVREILRNVIDNKTIEKYSRAGRSQWPADFWLLLTSNPCPCGYARGSDLSHCRCSDSSRITYQNRISGPILSRVGVTLFIDDDHMRAPTWVPKSLVEESQLIPQVLRKIRKSMKSDTRTAKQALQEYCANTNWSFSERKWKNISKMLTAMHGLSNAPMAEIIPTLLTQQISSQNIFRR
ncbi:ATP-binding protein [bacterium]|nr:ATP-binding protein [bacterium]